MYSFAGLKMFDSTMPNTDDSATQWQNQRRKSITSRVPDLLQPQDHAFHNAH